MKSTYSIFVLAGLGVLGFYFLNKKISEQTSTGGSYPSSTILSGDSGNSSPQAQGYTISYSNGQDVTNSQSNAITKKDANTSNSGIIPNVYSGSSAGLQTTDPIGTKKIVAVPTSTGGVKFTGYEIQTAQGGKSVAYSNPLQNNNLQQLKLKLGIK